MIPYTCASKQDSYLAKLPKYEASFNRVYTKYKHAAKKKDRQFLLTRHEFRDMCERPCTYCNAPPTPADDINHMKLNGQWAYNGLDRIDSSKGYTMSNVQPCCGLCNRLKSDIDEEVFLNHIKKIVFLSYWLGSLKDE